MKGEKSMTEEQKTYFKAMAIIAGSVGLGAIIAITLKRPRLALIMTAEGRKIVFDSNIPIKDGMQVVMGVMVDA